MEWSTLSWVIHITVLLLVLLICSGNSEEDNVRSSLVGFLHQLSADNTQIVHDLGWNASIDPCTGWKNVACNSKTSSLQAIRLKGLGLQGSINASLLCQAPSLSHVALQNNAIQGELPPEISNCSGLKILYLGGNRLSGSLPSSLPLLGNLKVLDISNNSFSGELPDLAKISGLASFQAQNNHLSGTIPAFWFGNFDRRRFNVSNNLFAGLIPQGGDHLDQSSFMGNPGLCGKPLPDACPPAPSPSEEDGKSLREKAIMFSGYIALGLVLLLFMAYKMIRRKKTNDKKVGNDKNADGSAKSSIAVNKTGTSRSEYSIPSSTDAAAMVSSSSLIVLKKSETTTDLKFEDLLKAPAELLGRGRFGSMYKVIMADGAALAVKRIKDGGSSAAEFRRRMERVDMARPPNVLPAVAFYCSVQEKLAVYEYQQNGSLFNLLHGSQAGQAFDWSCRLRVAAEIAEGLAFMHKELHADGIGHGNLKSSNILLNNNMDPCISEYGIIAVGNHNLNDNSASKSINHINGSTFKADVYGFGIILLELLTGKLVQNDPFELARWVNSVVREEWTVEVFDKALISEGASEEKMVQTLQVGLKCIHPTPDARPSMDHVATMINTIKEEDERSIVSEAQD